MANCSSMNQYLSDIQRCLQREFYPDNFREIAALALDGARSADGSLLFFVFWKIFQSLDLDWRERPLTVATAERIKAHFMPALDRYLQAARAGVSPELEVKYLNEIIRAYLTWLDIQREIPWG